MSNFILEELTRKSIFLDESKFSLDYIPKQLISRDNQLRILANYYRNLVLNPGHFKQTVLVQGPIGSGKTAIAKYFGMELEKTAQKRRINFRYLHLNCRKLRSEASVLTTILRYLVPYFPPRGFGVDELLRMLSNTLEHQDMHLLLALDEIDFLIKRGANDLLYHLTRINDDCPNNAQRVSLLLITREYALRSWVDASTRSSLTQNIIELDPYSQLELTEILTRRVETGFQRGAVPQEIIEEIAGIGAEEKGDARVAIELLWRAGKYADQEGSKVIRPEHIRKVVSSISTATLLHRDLIQHLPQHQLIVLLAVARTLHARDETSLSLAEVREAYSLLCEQMNEVPRRQTQIYQYCRDLASQGLFRIKILNKNIPGRTSRISIDAPIKTIEEIAAEILTH
ncbi:MAG: ORC1-type DNA replication protein [Candidatus Hodarchaeota archaeon]